ncbi:cytochrome c maturation protein CcmE [Archaeoglobales archaeon]|mgnify:CR=1 FL=1|nr:MAG: cytochrome c maturation protein CcmE [Archaeoglobales archaeon]
MENKGKLLTGVVIIGFSLAITFSLFHSISPYMTVSDLLNAKTTKNIQVVGEIVKGSIKAKDNETIFEITDGTNKVRVVYAGQVIYYEGQIVVIGDYENGIFYATEVLRKCHTEYKVGG